MESDVEGMRQGETEKGGRDGGREGESKRENYG